MRCLFAFLAGGRARVEARPKTFRAAVKMAVGRAVFMTVVAVISMAVSSHFITPELVFR